MNTKEIVTKILATRVDVSNLKEDDLLSSIGLDSLDLVEVMLEIETELGIEFESEELATLKTLGDVLAAIESHTLNK